jgi:hypothetical protein
VAPELRKERLKMINDGFGSPSQGRYHAEFRYTDDPQAKCRVLVLDRSEAQRGSQPRVTLVSGVGQWYFVPFPQGGGQERWKIRHRRPYHREAR